MRKNKATFNCYKCLLKNIGATILGSKPAELRSVKLHGQWEQCKKMILTKTELEIIELYVVREGVIKVLFYHKKALDKQLSEPNNLRFLKQFGYPEEYSLTSYVQFLVNRLQADEFPHEIGIFFGYPLKDVLGFMGHIDLEVVANKEWKFYGNRSLSDLRLNSFQSARKEVSNRLEAINNLNELDKIV